jgi:hypothetical protein
LSKERVREWYKVSDAAFARIVSKQSESDTIRPLDAIPPFYPALVLPKIRGGDQHESDGAFSTGAD